MTSIDHAIPFWNLSQATAQDFLKIIRMVAACWGCGYEAHREFDTLWKLEAGACTLIDAADKGAYSIRVEGLYVRYLIGVFAGVPPKIPANLLDADGESDGEVQYTFLRSDWDPSMASAKEWSALRQALSDAANSNGGFFSIDMAFADIAIDRLAAGGSCEAGSCSRLPK
jgi:hypothetical protein